MNWAEAYQHISEALHDERRAHGEIVSRLVGRAVEAELELKRQRAEYTKVVAHFEANAAALRAKIRELGGDPDA